MTLGQDRQVPRYAKPKPTVSDRAARAMRIFGANELRSAILEHLARQAGGVTSGQIATSLEAAYQTVFRHLQSLEAEGVVVSDAGPTRHGQRVRYSLDADARDRALADYRAYLDGDL